MRFDRTDLIYRLRHTLCFFVFFVVLRVFVLGGRGEVEARSRRGRGEVEVFRAVAIAAAIAVATAVAIDRLFD